MSRKFVLAVIAAYSTTSLAEILVDPVAYEPNESTIAGGVFAMSEVDYETDGSNLEVDRRILGATITKAISPKWIVFGQLGLGLDVEYENDYDGTGFNFGGGAKTVVYEADQRSVSILGALDYTIESVDRQVGGNKLELESKLLELHLAATFNYRVEQNLQVFGGLDLVPLGDGEVSVKGAGASGDNDFERDDIFSIRGGARIFFDDLTFRGELAIIGQQTLTLALESAI